MTKSREIIAILRGLTTARAIGVCQILIEAGISKIEVPLNSPDPMKTIKTIINEFGDHALIGAGTVLNVAEVDELADLGAGMVISPNTNVDVIRQTRARGMLSYPGVLTPTEAFAAIGAGCSGLKIFPAFKLGLDGYLALKAVLPTDIPVYAVGGVGADDFAVWREAGITGFGIGSAVFSPKMTDEEIKTAATALAMAWDAA